MAAAGGGGASEAYSSLAGIFDQLVEKKKAGMLTLCTKPDYAYLVAEEFGCFYVKPSDGKWSKKEQDSFHGVLKGGGSYGEIIRLAASKKLDFVYYDMPTCKKLKHDASAAPTVCLQQLSSFDAHPAACALEGLKELESALTSCQELGLDTKKLLQKQKQRKGARGPSVVELENLATRTAENAAADAAALERDRQRGLEAAAAKAAGEAAKAAEVKATRAASNSRRERAGERRKTEEEAELLKLEAQNRGGVKIGGDEIAARYKEEQRLKEEEAARKAALRAQYGKKKRSSAQAAGGGSGGREDDKEAQGGGGQRQRRK